MAFPTNIDAWLKTAGFTYEKVEETSASNAVRTVAGYRDLEWSKAVLQMRGLLLLRPISSKKPLMTGLLIPSLTIKTSGYTAEALNHLMTTHAYTQLVEGIEAYQGGCLIDGLGTAHAVFSAVH